MGVEVGGFSPPHVLIADDDPACLIKLEKAFHRQGFQTVSCTDGREAWMAIQQRPNVVLAVLNWMMPGMDGHMICRRLHERQSTVVPVLMIGRSFLHEAWTRLYLRTQYVLAKPFSETEINRQVCALIRLAIPRHTGRRNGLDLSTYCAEPNVRTGPLTGTSGN